MKAIGYKVPGPIAADAALVDINLPRPVAAGYDILVEVKAVSVNPVDYKVRNSTPPADGDWKVLGWDAAGIVREVGPDVTQFELGDEVYYAGSITRPGTNAEFHLVDARIVGHKPASLSWAEAAALPLTTLTAWEAMFDRLDVAKPVPGAAEAILIIGGAGGVVDRRPDRATAHGPHRHRHSLSTGNPRVGKRAWSSPRHRPFSSARATDRRTRHRCSRFRLFDHTYRATCRRHRRTDRPTRTVRTDRRSQGIRYHGFQAQGGVDPPRADVHAVDLRHARHE